MKIFVTVLVVLAVGVFGAMLAPSAYADGILGSTASTFAVLGASAVTNTGVTTIDGNVGVSPGTSLTGTTLCPGVDCLALTGTIHNNDAVAGQAQSDLTTAYNTVAGKTVTQTLTGTDLGGLTLPAGVYFFKTSAQLTGALVLNAQGLDNQTFIFQIGSTLTTASASSVTIENPGAHDAVYWDVGTSATLGTTTAFLGNIFAVDSITFNTGATDNCGRALAETALVALDTNTISIGCANVQEEGGSNGLNGGGPATPPVPEPGTLLLLGSGLAGLIGKAGMRRAKVRKA
jgi:hypothetical protein